MQRFRREGFLGCCRGYLLYAFFQGEEKNCREQIISTKAKLFFQNQNFLIFFTELLVRNVNKQLCDVRYE